MNQTLDRTDSKEGGTSGLTLSLLVPERVPLDEVLVAVATLTNSSDRSVVTSARLNLLEGDLDVLVTGPGGSRTNAGWPWPADSGARQVSLGPGQSLMGGVLLLSAAGVAPLFPTAGHYDLVAEFRPSRGELLRSETVPIERMEPADEADRKRRRALDNVEVAQSLASSSCLGVAGELLSDLERHGSPATRLLAALAVGDTAGIGKLAAEVSGQAGPVAAAAAVSAILPGGLASGDERLETIASVLAAFDDDGRATAMLRAEPWLLSQN
ncbi:hypothetical protein GCM10009712_17300 [Pseudarthrobacter sulfonivorans]|uniref:hypothetical protein n=1 Tax=Pseudarthrobacter sulfonivorans TaxID=121292 RepID=UPI00168C0585|nr:hypothetical protein [Pseudarthrobacter sulfonivorans]